MREREAKNKKRRDKEKGKLKRKAGKETVTEETADKEG